MTDIKGNDRSFRIDSAANSGAGKMDLREAALLECAKELKRWSDETDYGIEQLFFIGLRLLSSDSE